MKINPENLYVVRSIWAFRSYSGTETPDAIFESREEAEVYRLTQEPSSPPKILFEVCTLSQYIRDAVETATSAGQADGYEEGKEVGYEAGKASVYEA